MDEVREEVIVDLRIERNANDQQIDVLTKKINELKTANKELLDNNKELVKQGKENSNQFNENSKQIEINKQKISDATASRKGLIQTLIAEDSSIKALQISNRELIAQRNLISTSTEEGRKKIAQINAQIDENNEKIKQNSSALEKQRLNIGNYASALDRVIPGLGAMITQIQLATRAAWTFIATPLGLAITAVAAALVPLISYLTSTSDGMDIVTRESEGFSQVLRGLRNELNEIGKSQVEFFSNLFSSIPQIKALTAAYNAAAKAGREYADALDDIDTRQTKASIELARLNNEIKRTILQSKDRTLSEQERIDKIEEALSLESRANLMRKGFAQDELSAIVKLAEANSKLRRANFENEVEFAEALIDEFDATDEDIKKKLVDALIKLEEVEAESIGIVEKLMARRNELMDKAEAEDKERRERQRRAREEEEQAESDALVAKLNAELQIIEDTQKALDEDTLTRDKALKASLAKSDEDLNKKSTDSARAQQKIFEKIQNDKKKIAQDFFNVSTELLALATESQQSQAIIQTLVSTYSAAQRAYESQFIPGEPSSFGRALLAAAFSVFQGLARVAQIRSFHDGGMLEGPSHRDGGIPFSVGGRLGFEAEGGEAIINKRSVAMFRPLLSAINQAGGGVAFEDGGVTGKVISNFNRTMDLQKMLTDSVGGMQIFVTVEDINAKQSEVNDIKLKARVINDTR